MLLAQLGVLVLFKKKVSCLQSRRRPAGTGILLAGLEPASFLGSGGQPREWYAGWLWWGLNAWKAGCCMVCSFMPACHAYACAQWGKWQAGLWARRRRKWGEGVGGEEVGRVGK